MTTPMVRMMAVLAVMVPGLALGEGVVQMPQELPVVPEADPMPALQVQPQFQPQAMPQQMPQAMPQTQPLSHAGPERFMLECRTSRTRLAFVIDTKNRIAENVSSFPQSTGAVFEKDSEYVLTFLDPTAIEFFISRYTGRMTAILDGAQVIASGVCRKGQARTLF